MKNIANFEKIAIRLIKSALIKTFSIFPAASFITVKFKTGSNSEKIRSIFIPFPIYVERWSRIMVCF